MKNTKGFTLIELLAVIVILAVIALIATPMVLDTINDAKKGAVQSSAYSVISAVENELAGILMDHPTSTLPASIVWTSSDVTVKGTQPVSISLGIAGGVVTDGYITFEDGVATITKGQVTSVSMK